VNSTPSVNPKLERTALAVAQSAQLSRRPLPCSRLSPFRYYPRVHFLLCPCKVYMLGAAVFRFHAEQPLLLYGASRSPEMSRNLISRNVRTTLHRPSLELRRYCSALCCAPRRSSRLYTAWVVDVMKGSISCRSSCYLQVFSSAAEPQPSDRQFRSSLSDPGYEKFEDLAYGEAPVESPEPYSYVPPGRHHLFVPGSDAVQNFSATRFVYMLSIICIHCTLTPTFLFLS
jgi:hypothetical protein